MKKKKFGLIEHIRHSKKAAISIPIRLIVIIIIALVVFILAVAFIRRSFEMVSTRVGAELGKYALPPTAVISSPDPEGIYTIFNPIKFDGSASYDQYYRITGYFWDFDGDSVIDSREAVIEHSYWEPGEYNVSLKVVNEEGAIGTASIILKVYTNNEKDMERYEDSLFLIRDNEGSNEEIILRLVPVMTWNDAYGFHTVPYYVYHKPGEEDTLTEEELEKIMEKYGKKYSYIFEDNAAVDNYCSEGEDHCLYNWGEEGKYNIEVFKEGNIDNIYFDFWKIYEDVILVDPDESDAKLIASLFAGFYNSPIIFIDSSNLEGYQDQIMNKDEEETIQTQRIYYVPSIDSIDSEVDEWVTGYWDRQAYTVEELRDPRGVNRIIRLTSNVTMGTT